MKKAIIFILFFVIFADFGIGKIYANDLEQNESLKIKTNSSNITKFKKTEKNKKITLSSFYGDKINESDIKEKILKARKNAEKSKRTSNFIKSVVNVLEDLYEKEQNKEL